MHRVPDDISRTHNILTSVSWTQERHENTNGAELRSVVPRYSERFHTDICDSMLQPSNRDTTRSVWIHWEDH